MHNILPFCSRKMDTHKLLWLLCHNKYEMPTLRCMSFQVKRDGVKNQKSRLDEGL